MRAKFWILSASLVCAAMIAASPVQADVDWSGPGYYLADDVNDIIGGFLSGPFSSEGDCENAKALLPDDDKQYSDCGYYPSDPDADTGQN